MSFYFDSLFMSNIYIIVIDSSYLCYILSLS